MRSERIQLEPGTNMKYRLINHIAAAVVLAVALALALSAATVACGADGKGVPKPPPRLPKPPAIDPNTGLPVAPTVWIDPEWKDPDKMLPDVVCDGLPLGEIAQMLRQEFKGQFDVLIPNSWQEPRYPTVSFDPFSISVSMQLKNVSASEIFNAMNMKFEAENAPCRWELKMNGNRPTAMLRVLPQLLRIPDPEPPTPPRTRMVYFVGDLVSDEKPGGMTVEQLVKTVSDVYKMSYGESKGVVQFHKDAQLIIITGTSDQIEFVQQTLSALREKGRAVQWPQTKSGEPKAKTEDPKSR